MSLNIKKNINSLTTNIIKEFLLTLAGEDEITDDMCVQTMNYFKEKLDLSGLVIISQKDYFELLGEQEITPSRAKKSRKSTEKGIPKSGYNLFQSVISKAYKKANKKITLSQFSEEWKKLSDEIKNIFREECKKAIETNTQCDPDNLQTLLGEIKENDTDKDNDKETFNYDYSTFLKFYKFLKSKNIIENDQNAVTYWSNNIKSLQKDKKQQAIDEWFQSYSDYIELYKAL